MTITDVTVAAAATGNNSSVAPAAPSGVIEGDLVLIAAAIRNSGTGTVDTPAGWSLLTPAGSFAVLGRFWQTGDAMPTVTFTGGVVNADTYARALKARGVAPNQLAEASVAVQTNASAQNIAYPALDVFGNAQMLIMALWKSDDATSLGTPAGWTAQGHTNMTTGDDMLNAWFTQIQTDETDVGASSVTVTGGVAAISKAIMIGLMPAVTFTVDIQDEVYPPRALLTVSGLVDDEFIELYRVVDNERTLVRGGDIVNGGLLGDDQKVAYLRIDGELPFGVPVHWVAEVNGAEYTSQTETVALPGGKVALSDAVTALAAEVVVLAWPEKNYERRTSRYVLANGRTKVVSGPPAQFTGTLELFTEQDSSRRQVQALLDGATSNIVQVRQSGGYNDVDCYVAVLSYSVRRDSQDGTDDRRVFVLDVAEVSPWAASFEARGYTLQDLADVYEGLTLAQIGNDFATMLDLARAELIP